MTTRFKKIGLWGHLGETGVSEPALEIITQLRVLGLDVLIPDQENIPAGFRNATCVPADQLGAEVDLIIAVGGDGTMLHAARRAAMYSVPLLGVNRGRLGFLTDVSPELMAETIGAVISGDYIAETRLMLQAKITNTKNILGPMLALNDVALKTVHTGHMQDFCTYVDGEYVNTHGGDGLIIATPTGSTAYALSAGGSIIHPELDLWNIIPMMSQSLSSRPLIVSNNKSLEIQLIQGPLENAMVCVDGQQDVPVQYNDSIIVRKKDSALKIIHPANNDFYEACREKLGWSLDITSKKT